MDKECRELLKKLYKTGIVDNESKQKIKLLLNQGFFESQIISRADIENLFEDIDFHEITDNQMEEIASLIQGENLDDSYWSNLETAAKKVLKIQKD